MSRSPAAAALAAVAALTAGLCTAAPARAADAGPDLPVVSDLAVAESVRSIAVDQVYPIRLGEAVSSLQQTVREGPDTVVRLNSDILFAFGKATIAPAAKQRLGTLLAPVPRRARLTVAGYTDSIGSTSSNLRLSQQRAKAVAAVVRAARPDLRLTVRGYGEADPVTPNTSGGKDDPGARAKNRRVEPAVPPLSAGRTG
ncbi:hypothetical protein GCM10025868_35220 [Angustibacter aerolatus]|uniref:OmpA-like domain-containing protein n=1 Tax=Angustibacter aerolatus TaxID=1162965 RepID=A0ABQ6JJ41_9ACTN|nr:hypothetical protein GCM10025868_35220 [Angustibacter aerolatus]